MQHLQLATVTKVSGGGVYFEAAQVAPGREFGPCIAVYGAPAVGDRIVVAPLGDFEDDWVVLGEVDGVDPGLFLTKAANLSDVANAATARTNLGVLVDQAAGTGSMRTLGTGALQAAAGNHTHDASAITTGTLALARLPVAASGVSSSTQVVRADDSRLSDARTPTSHTHDASAITSGILNLSRIPVATDGQVSVNHVVRSDDSRLSNARTPTGAAGGALSGTYPDPGIATAAVGNTQLAAGSVTAAKLSTSSLATGLILNGTFGDGLENWALGSSGSNGSLVIATGQGGSGTNVAALARGAGATNSSFAQTSAAYFPVHGATGRPIRFGMRAKASTAVASSTYLRIFWYQADKVTAASTSFSDPVANAAAGTTWATYDGAVVPPANAAWGRASVIAGASYDSKTLYVDQITADEVITSEGIDDALKDAAAGTASLRTIGTGALQAAAGNHTHTGLSDSGWVAIDTGLSVSRVRKVGDTVTLQVDGSATTTSGTVLTLTNTAIPAAYRPGALVRAGGYFGGHPGTVSVDTSGVVTALQQSGANRGSVSATITYMVN